MSVVAPPVDAEAWRRWSSNTVKARNDGAFLARELADYARDGICVVKNVVPVALLDEARAHVAWLAEHNPGRRPEHFDMMHGDPFWHRLVSDPVLLDIAEQFVGPDIALFQTHWIAKPPRDGLPVLLHQDGAYWTTELGWGGGRDPMITLRLICDDEDEENGCMQIVAGSHLDPLHAVRRQGLSVKRSSDRIGAADENVLGTHIDLPDIPADSLRSVPISAGDVSIHSSRLVHGSGPNHSARWRRGLTISYMPAHMRVVRTKNEAHAVTEEAAQCEGNYYPYLYLLRGSGVAGVNDGSPRSFRWNARPVFHPGRHMEFRGMGAYFAAPPPRPRI
jgi:phytanoyl-CoA hydroxylase